MNVKSREKVGNWRLYVIMDKQLAGNRSYEEIVGEVIKGGADVIQLRDKLDSKEELIEIGKKLRKITRETGVSFIVNDYPEIAKVVDADGVHIGQEDISFEEAKKIVGENKIVGLSTHNKEQILKAIKLGADYIGVGPVFETASKENPDPIIGVELIKWVSEKCDIPFVAIGGINLNNLDKVLSAGARCIAVISAIMQAENIKLATEQFKKVINNFFYHNDTMNITIYNQKDKTILY